MKKLIFLGAAMLLLVAACSHDENNNGGTEPLQKVQFSFTNEDFGADEALTRATSAAEKPQTIDLGDCEAEISVENEPAVKTRGALTNANGHYTIRAYQGGTLKGEMKGTFSGGAFTADASSPKSMNLPDGTYDFIAFNDDVVPSGNELTVAKDKAATAMMGTTTELINQYPDQTVNFTMKHVGCRLRTQFVCQKHIPNAITATLEQTAANVIPTSVSYAPATKAYTGTLGTMAAKSSNSPASAEAKYVASNYGLNHAYTSSSNYHYFLPTTEGSKLKLTGISAGTVFWKPIPTFNVPKLNATLQMQAGKSYVVKIKLNPNYTYLMSDGTTGFFKQTTYGGGSKTPIAVVLDASQHIALALKDIGSTGYVMNWCTNELKNIQTNVNMASATQALTTHARSGLAEAWDPHYSTGGCGVKAANPKFIAHRAAATYNPGVAYTGTPALVWYLPSYHDWKQVFSKLGFGEVSNVTTAPKSYSWYGYLASGSYLKVGGIGGDEWFWTSSEITPSAVGTLGLFGAFMAWDSAAKDYSCAVRAFVKY